MNEIEKLFKKISASDRLRINQVLKALLLNEIKGLKLKGNSNMHRIRVGRYRIVYTIKKEEILIHTIRLRNEKTYK